jgi:hypothetical protein
VTICFLILRMALLYQWDIYAAAFAVGKLPRPIEAAAEVAAAAEEEVAAEVGAAG